MDFILESKMKKSELKQLIKEEISKVLSEKDWKGTSWEDEEDKITIGDVVKYIGDNVEDVLVSDLENELKSQLAKVTKEEDRIMNADLRYPIILVKRDGKIEYILDGNHRLAKAIMTGEKHIKSRILDLDNPETPEKFKKIL